MTEDVLEAYLLGRLPGQQQDREDDPEVQSVEEHLLWCEPCQLRAEEQEIEIAALRNVLSTCDSVPRETRRHAKALATMAKAMVVGTY